PARLSVYSCCAHPALLSFPTRRSSDLGVRMVRVVGDEQNVKLHRIPPLLGSAAPRARWRGEHVGRAAGESMRAPRPSVGWLGALDRKSTRLNSSHVSISYAVFCLKKKT